MTAAKKKETSNPIFDYIDILAPPKGWEAGVKAFGPDDIQITLPPQKYDPSKINPKATKKNAPGPWDDIMRNEGFDPEIYEVIEPIQWSSWDSLSSGSKERNMSVKLRLRSKLPSDIDLYAIYEELKKKKPVRKMKVNGDDALLVCIADPQVGKPDGDGVEGVMRRLAALEQQVIDRIEELRKMGRPIKRLVVAFMGDLIENCDGHYAMQTYGVQLNLRDQVKTMRRIIMNLLDAWFPHVEQVVVVAVPGNHGENRKNGKAYTDFADNYDVALVEQVYDAFLTNPKRYANIEFLFPTDQNLTVTTKVAGTGITFAHGHQFRKQAGGSIANKAWNWWKGQAFGYREPLLASILISAHYHHWNSQSRTEGRWWFQCPALEDKSQWFEEETGENAQAGVLTMVLSEKGPSDIQIIM